MFNWMKKRKKKFKIVTPEGVYDFKDGDILMLNGLFSCPKDLELKGLSTEISQ